VTNVFVVMQMTPWCDRLCRSDGGDPKFVEVHRVDTQIRRAACTAAFHLSTTPWWLSHCRWPTTLKLGLCYIQRHHSLFWKQIKKLI